MMEGPKDAGMVARGNASCSRSSVSGWSLSFKKEEKQLECDVFGY